MTQHDHVHVAAGEADAVPVPSARPYPKVVAGGAAGAVTVIVVYIAGLLGLDVPAHVASAFTTLTSIAAAYLKTD